MSVHDPLAAFPRTHVTWLHDRLADGDAGRAQALRHVMAVYYDPLRTYFERSRYRRDTCGEDAVGDFFAYVVSREGYLERWRASEKRLHDWLLLGLWYRLMAERKKGFMHGTVEEPVPDIALEEPGPYAEMLRSLRQSILRAALLEAQRTARSVADRSGLELLSLQYLDGLSPALVREKLGITTIEATRLARHGRKLYRRALGEVLERDGVPPERLRAAIEELLNEDEGPA